MLGAADESVDQRRLQYIADGEKRRGDRQQRHQRIEAEGHEHMIGAYMAMTANSPCAKLTTRTTPKITDRPSAISP